MRSATDALPIGEARPQRPQPQRTQQPLSGYVTTELLVPYFRVARRPLPTWTASLHERLTESSAKPHAEWYAACDGIASCFNEGALVELHFGRADRSLSLCLREIDWAYEVSRAPGRLAAAQFAFQPSINIGRLHRHAGRWNEAIAAFRLLEHFCGGATVEIGGVRITDDHAAAIRAANPEFDDQMLSNYLIDTILTLLRAEHFAEVDALAGDAPRARSDWANDLVYEARIIALSHLGRIDAAHERVDAYLRRDHRPYGSVFLFRRAELLLASGDRDGAARIASGLAIAHMKWIGPVDKLNLRLMIRVARLLASIGHERALSAARAALSNARASNDVLLQQELLTLIATQAPTDEERLDARAQADALSAASWFGAARANATGAADAAGAANAAIDSLYDRLMSCTAPS